MYSLETIHALNERPIALKDNFNRDSSYVQSSKGFVIHSGIHRSTAFISKEEHADGWHAFNYWKSQGQAAINGFIEASIDGACLDDCEANAFFKARPQWHVLRSKMSGSAKGKTIDAKTAFIKGNAIQTRVSAFVWSHLHARTA